jgi:putative inorganic carbon (hco3(-)) transporter
VQEQLKTRILYVSGFIFILLTALFIYSESFWYATAIIPVAIILFGLTFLSLDKLMLFIVFATPLSFSIEDATDFGIGIFLPTEPLLFGVMLLFFIKLIHEKKFDTKIINHPISLAIIFHLIWVGITVITSEMPLVSFKAFLSKLWFVIGGYFIFTQVFVNYSNIKKSFWLYIIPLLIAVSYTVIRHSTYGFDEKAGHWVMWPFFKDHTSYGAILAMYFPFVVASLFDNKLNYTTKMIVFGVLTLLTVGVVLSYTRAAWVSLIFVLGVYVAFVLKIKFRTILLLIGTVVLLLFTFQDEIKMTLEKNKQDSSSDFAEHAQSITNVATDASNLERINRWNCAFRMFEERPIFGWGPGTYMFLYAPYQHSKELTIISTNFGDKGNAHSEYFGPLAESGLLGALSFVFIIILVIYKASMLYIRTDNKEHKLIIMSCLLGLITYYVHGFLNNFLDTDKAAIPFWSFTAIIVAMEVYHFQKKSIEPTAD